MSDDRERIESINLESALSHDLAKNREEKQRDFCETFVKSTDFTSGERILQLASNGDLGVARSVAIEQLTSKPRSRGALEVLALLETYAEEEIGVFFWSDRLLQEFPQSEIGLALNSIRVSIRSRDWELVRENATSILKVDKENWFALIFSARANSALGNWEASSDNWRVIRNLKDLTVDEEYEAARTSYNAKRFSEVIEIASFGNRAEDVETKILELLIRSNYNLGNEQGSIDNANKLLEMDPESEIGLRYLSRSLIRQGRLSLAIPIIEQYCRVSPFTVDAWESLIETQLLMDKVIGASETWKALRSQIGDESRGFFTALEVALRFNWKERYRSLIENEGEVQKGKSGFAEKVAEINFRTGDLGSSWRALSSNGVDPMKSTLSEKFSNVFLHTNTNSEEVDSIAETGNSLWITELVTREILRKAGPRRRIRKSKGVCHLVTSSLDRGGAERQVAMTLKHVQGLSPTECYLVAHRVNNKKGVETYFDELIGLHDRIFDLEGNDFDDQDCAGREIIEENAFLLALLDPVVRKKVEQLIFHFSEYKPDLVHAWQDETILTTCLAGALTGVPVVIGSARSLRPDEKTELHIRKRPYLQNCFKEIFNYNYHHLSSNSVAGRESYAEWIGIERTSIWVNENGVDFDEIESGMRLNEVNKRMSDFGFSESNKIVGGLFRLEAGKRPELWIESFEKAREIDPTLRGLIVGGGRMEETVRKWIEESELEKYVKVVGEVVDVGSWLTVMDIFLFTSATEGLPNVLIEAQGFGVPVVSTRVGGVPEVVSDGETGCLVEEATSKALGEAVIELLGDEKFDEICKITEKISRKRFAVEEMATRTVEMYSRVMSLEENSG